MVSRAEHPLNIRLMSVVLLVSNEERSIVFSAIQLVNIQLVFKISFELKLLRSRAVRLLQQKNIYS